MSGTRPPSADSTTYVEAAAPRSRENQPTGDRDGAGAGAIGSRGTGAPLLDARAPGAPRAQAGLFPRTGGHTPATVGDEDTRLEDAIARRNLTWAHYEAASQMLRAAERAGRPETVLRPLRRNYNDAQHDWEWAIRNLQRERVRFAYETGTHWSQRRVPA